jgi:hypothetical protein
MAARGLRDRRASALRVVGRARPIAAIEQVRPLAAYGAAASEDVDDFDRVRIPG